MPLRHRKSINHGLFFATTSTQDMIARFNSPEKYSIVLEKIEYYRKRENASIHAYVVMPNHFHLLIHFPENHNISAFMRDLKKRIAYEYYQLQKVPPFPFWQDRFDDLLIYSEKQYAIKLNYIHNNPVKSGLVGKAEDWEYSSVGFYIAEKCGIVTVNPRAQA